MPKVYIVGNAGAARECYWLLRDVCETGENHVFGGFLSWAAHPDNLKELKSHSLGAFENHAVDTGALYVIGVGATHIRKAVFDSLKARGARLMNLIHPSVYLCPSAVLGEGNILQRNSVLMPNARLGDGNFLNGAVSLAHDVDVANFNFLGPFATLLGGVSLGSLNHLGPSAVLLEHTRVGNNNSIAPGAILYKGCGDNCRMAGQPALKIGNYDGC